eukprot:COSAG02_NODE_797_length_17106_cov_4.363615_5_plen_203_part_00
MVALCDEKTSSDGEAFIAGFQENGLGTVIGVRTWGGEIWLSRDNRLVDGGIASAPEMGGECTVCIFHGDGNVLCQLILTLYTYVRICVPACLRACLPACLCSVVFGLDGEWFIENRGAIPDIVVDNLPHATFLGEDAQLRRGVAELLTQLQSDPIETPVHPPYPDRSYQGKIHRFAQHKQLTTAPLTWNASIVSGPVNEQCP